MVFGSETVSLRLAGYTKMNSILHRMREIIRLQYGLPIILAFLLFTVLIGTAWNYGIFRDEMYFLDCGEHLDFGYVDHPPMIAIAARAGSMIFGHSILAVRFIPALAGAALVLLLAAMARKLGGGKFAMTLASLAMFFVPSFLGNYSQLNITLFEMLIWSVCAYLFIDILSGAKPKQWLWLGLFIGLSLQTKTSALVFGFALVASLLLTKHRQQLSTKWPYLGGAVAILVFLPNLIWQNIHGWPTLEFISNAQGSKIFELSPVGFLAQVTQSLNPVSLPLWLGGLVWLFLSKDARKFRPLAVFFIVALLVFISQSSKYYYIFPAIPLLFAAGAVAFEQMVKKLQWYWLKPVYTSVLILSGIMFAPLALPILQPEPYIAYANAIGVAEIKSENHERVALPQHLADRFGWKELATAVAATYNKLPEEDRKKCAIWMGNYGEAGAISYFGGELGLPRPISAHNSHWIWGPREYTGEVVITFGIPSEILETIFESVQPAALISHPYVMAYENNKNIYICRNLSMSITEIWPRAKSYN